MQGSTDLSGVTGGSQPARSPNKLAAAGQVSARVMNIGLECRKDYKMQSGSGF